MDGTDEDRSDTRRGGGRGRRGHGGAEGRRGSGRGRRGRGEWGPPGPEGWGPMGPGRGRGRPTWGAGAKVKRGDTRDAVVLVLLDGPMHGYQIMGELADRSGGAWTPSPGSVYPVLKQLEADGLVSVTKEEGRRLVELTDAGRETAQARAAEGPPPWAALAEGADHRGELWESARQLAQAVSQVADAGSAEEIEQAAALLDGVRRQLYRLLAGDAPAG